MKKIFFLFLALMLFSWHPENCAAADQPRGVLDIAASTFPVYLFTAAVCADVPGVKVELVVPSALGCPHNFTLRPADMRKLRNASILVINGAGLEDFLKKPLAALENEPHIIDAGKDVPLLETGEADHTQHGHDDHGGVNPHIFASPENAAAMVENIARELALLDVDNAQAYQANGRKYVGMLKDLSRNLAAIGKKAVNRGIAIEHDALAYLVKNANLDIMAVFENSASASSLATVTKDLVTKKPALLAGDVQYPDKLLKILSGETGIPFASLDPCASGPEGAGPAYYEEVMKQNIKTLEARFD